MTILESVVALVIVGLAAVGFLNVFEGAARSPRAAAEWNSAVATAEEGMELVKLGPRVGGGQGSSARRVERRAYSQHLDEVRVIATLAGGRTFELRRLVRAR